MLVTFCLCFIPAIIVCHSLQFNTGNVYQFTTEENTGENGQTLGTVTCTEAGGASLNGSVTYTILQPESLPFTLDGASGDLSLLDSEVLDFEDTQEYLFNVSCTYNSDLSDIARALVRFSVEPVNEFLPRLSDVSLTVSINEETTVGTVLVARDGSSIIPYTVTDEDDGSDGELRFVPRQESLNLVEFHLDVDGSLVLLRAIDLDIGDVPFRQVIYDMIVCDGDRDEQECPSIRITIFITSSNDNPPIFEQDEYTISVSETTAIGTSLITVVCTDTDRNGVGEFKGIFVSSSNSPVEIPNERNGSIVLRDNLDFEITPIITASLTCRDSGIPILEDNATLVIMVTGVNDHAPSFNNILFECVVGRLAFIGKEICAIQAIDNDNDRILYTLSGRGSENFQIRPDGMLVLNDILLVAEGSFFELTVSASDGVFNDSTTVRITVSDLLSIPEIIVVAVCGVVLILVVIIVTVVCCCCFIRCYLWLKLDGSHRAQNKRHSSPGIEITNLEEEIYKLNSLDRTMSLKLEVMDDSQCDSLPDHCEANVIINKLGNSPILVDNVYSEVNPKIPELTYIQLGGCRFADTNDSSHNNIQHTTILEENEEDSEIESLYDEPLAISCPSLPSVSTVSVTPSRSLYAINKELDWGTVPESQLKKNKALARRN